MCLKLLTPYLTFAISMAVCIHMVVFWIMTLCRSVVGGYQCLQYNLTTLVLGWEFGRFCTSGGKRNELQKIGVDISRDCKLRKGQIVLSHS
jgi:hypothetical protein